MESVHEVNPNLLQKIFGAKDLKLNIKNYLISVSHKKNKIFDYRKIKDIKVKKKLFFYNIEITFEENSKVFNKLTKNQKNYYYFILKNLEAIKKSFEDILILTSGKRYINHKKLENWLIENKEILKFLNKSNKRGIATLINE